MRTAIIADVHIGNHRRAGGQLIDGVNARCRRILDALRLLRVEHGVESLIVCGDLFDYPRLEPGVLSATAGVLHEFRTVYLIAGNHDQVSPTETALDVFERDTPNDHVTQRIMVVRNAVGYIDLPRMHVVLVPYVPSTAEFISLLSSAKFSETKTNVVCAHIGIISPRTPEFLQKAHDAIHGDDVLDLMDDLNISSMCVGNWHNPYGISRVSKGHIRRVSQLGAFVPTGWDNPGIGYGNALVFDSNTVFDAILVHTNGPRFHVFETSDHGLLPDQLRTLGDALNYVRIKYRSEAQYRAYESAYKRLGVPRAYVEFEPLVGDIPTGTQHNVDVATTRARISEYVNEIFKDRSESFRKSVFDGVCVYLKVSA